MRSMNITDARDQLVAHVGNLNESTLLSLLRRSRIHIALHAQHYSPRTASVLPSVCSAMNPNIDSTDALLRFLRFLAALAKRRTHVFGENVAHLHPWYA